MAVDRFIDAAPPSPSKTDPPQFDFGSAPSNLALNRGGPVPDIAVSTLGVDGPDALLKPSAEALLSSTASEPTGAPSRDSPVMTPRVQRPDLSEPSPRQRLIPGDEVWVRLPKDDEAVYGKAKVTHLLESGSAKRAGLSLVSGGTLEVASRALIPSTTHHTTARLPTS